MANLIAISARLGHKADALRFGGRVSQVYNPLRYARAAHEHYLARCGGYRGIVLLVGMNPGPWGMVQTGVPFGEVAAVRDWMKIDGRIEAPAHQHPKVPIHGLACSRREVSGRRLWGWAQRRYGAPRRFFSRFFVWNYCPLCFLVASGANYTPDKLPRDEREALYRLCDRALVEIAELLRPRLAIGIGSFAQARLQSALGDRGIVAGAILHPSPANPRANRDWAAQAEAQLAALGAL